MRIRCIFAWLPLLGLWGTLSAPSADAGAPAAEGDSLSIAQCVAMARAAAPEVVAGAIDLEVARLDSLATRYHRRPTLALGGGATIAPHGFYDPAITNLGEYEIKAGFDLPLLDAGEAARARERAANAAGSAAADLDRAGRDAGLRAAQLAIEILRLSARRRAEASSLSWLQGLAALIDSGIRAGSHDPGDRLRVALEIHSVQSSLLSTDSDLTVARRELARMLGRPPEGMLPLRAPAEEEDRAPAPADSARVKERVAQMPEIRAQRLALEVRQIEMTEATRKNGLRLDLSADAGFAGTDLTAAVPPDLRAEDPGAGFGDRLKRDLGASVALGFRIPFADATARHEREARLAAVRAASTRLEQEERDQERLAGDLLTRWRAASARLDASSHIAGKAEEHLLRMKSLYAAGAASILELLDARRLVDDAREQLSDARAEARAARFEAEITQ